MPEIPEKVFSVGQLTQSIRRNLLLNNEKLHGVWIEGEVQSWKPWSNGNVYFDIKDSVAKIDCVMFSSYVAMIDDFGLTRRMNEGTVVGQKVRVQGTLDLNMSRGQYSYKVTKVKLADGMGERMAAFMALKEKLEKSGLNKLDHPELRRPLPTLPHRIGIVTSPTGAVIHDMATVLLRRFPNIEIRLYPVKVQGKGAAKEVVEGLRYFCEQEDWRADVILIGRGGGSADDLWDFNEEPIVMAVAESPIPVISCVGHESDTTLCDFAADLRAGTPSMAAELAVREQSVLLSKIDSLAGRLRNALMNAADTAMQNLDYATMHMVKSLENFAATRETALEKAKGKLEPLLINAVDHATARLGNASLRLAAPLQTALICKEGELRRLDDKLALLNPFNILERGYSLTTDSRGRVIRSASDVSAGDVINTRLANGVVVSKVS